MMLSEIGSKYIKVTDRSKLHVFTARQDIFNLSKDFPFDILTVELPPQDFISHEIFHCHDCIEISYMKMGHGCYYTMNQLVPIEAGDVMIFSSMQKHGWEGYPPDKIVQPVIIFDPTMISLPNDSAWFCRYLPGLVNGQASFINKLPSEHGLTAKVRAVFETIEQEYKMKDVGYQTVIKGYLLTMMGYIMRYLSEQEYRQDYLQMHMLQRLDGIIDYIHEHFKENITLAQLAKIAHMSPNYLSSYFKQAVGITIRDYISKLRLSAALELLKDQSVDITDAYYQAGFTNSAHFHKLFKRYIGMTPMEYRNQFTYKS